jgi:NADPH2:quinone reductase
MRATVIRRVGDPEVLVTEKVDEPKCGAGEVVVAIAAAGLNFIDTYHRTGLYPVELPFIPGLEAAGTILEVGSGVSRFEVGDRVAYASSSGAYAERAAVPHGRLVKVPESIGLDIAAASMLQGLTAHYLVSDTHPIEPGATCLIHAGAGGVGLLLTQMAKRLGATVFTTVGTKEKAAISAEAGADHVIVYTEEDFVDAIQGIAGERPLDVIYDGVGKTTMHRGFALLRPRGLMAVFGNASGAAEPVDPLTLSANGSLYLTRPTLFTHIADSESLAARAADLFSWIDDGLNVRIGARFPLGDAAGAHRALEGRLTTGKVLIELVST